MFGVSSGGGNRLVMKPGWFLLYHLISIQGGFFLKRKPKSDTLVVYWVQNHFYS
jgi:hypothetical protein